MYIIMFFRFKLGLHYEYIVNHILYILVHVVFDIKKMFNVFIVFFAGQPDFLFGQPNLGKI